MEENKIIDENEFVDIKGYEGLYKINRNGQVKSLSRIDNLGRFYNEIILKNIINSHGYETVILYKNKKIKCLTIHKLLFNNFINEYDIRYFAIDHIDRNRLNNNLNNLRLVTNRNNYNNLKKQSIYGCGVKITKFNKYQTLIRINNKKIHLGVFDTPDQAHSKYLEVKNQIEEIEKITRSYSFTKTKINDEYFLNFFPV